MPNVLMIGPSPDAMGGMATVENNILEAVRRRGDRAVFVSTYEEGGKPKKLAVAAAAYARYRMELGRCDLVHVHMASRGSYRRKRFFMEAAFAKGKPVLLHLHGSEFAVWFDDECSKTERDDISRTINRCSKVAVLSKEWKDYLLSRAICDEGRIEVLHNAVEMPPENRTDYSSNTVLFMGRLDERKSPDVLLKAAAEVLTKHPDSRFIFGGDGNVPIYESLAEELGIDKSCSFIGWAKGEAKEAAFRKSSMYCLPSKNEGMPMSVLEAMSYGLATLSTPVGGVPQVITDGVDGVLFPVGDVEALAAKLNALMGDETLKEEIGREGRSRIEEAFSLDAFMKHLIAIYEEICK